MFKTFALVLAVVAAVANANIYSGSTNTGMNVMSSGSNVYQSDIQNVGEGAGYGYGGYGGLGGYGGYGGYAGLGGYGGYGGYAGYPGYGGYSGYGGYAGHGYGYGGYGGGYGLGGYGGYGHGYGGYGHGYGGYGGWGGYGYDNINSQSNNIGANIMSTDSNVFQHNLQNVNNRY